MAAVLEADFGGWATKAGLKCTDGRTIMPGAFEHMDKVQVPLVFQHGHNNIDNILGHAVLEHRDEGVYAYAFFNDTAQGQKAKAMVKHRDLKHLSIYANQLVEKGKNVVHGVIREVSLVLAGANPGAVIDFVNLQHGDGSMTELEDEAVIFTDEELEHALDSEGVDDEETDDEEEEDDDLSHAAQDATIQDVWDSMTEEQQTVAQYLIGVAVESASPPAAQHSDKPGEGDLTHQEGADNMSRNVFDQSSRTATSTAR
jgi:hypothetical protein